ncbi:MAG TPA: hypothetical protein VHT30_02440 [Acidimicrobiales bacterium]|nr:hypothetical protein [Acidimicrobiales bacterium]
MARKRSTAETDAALATTSAPGVLVCIGEDRLTATISHPLLFGRADATSHRGSDASPGPATIIGLDPQDMGISARALAVEFDAGVWWLTNLSAKRNLLLDPGYGSAMITLRPGQRHAIAVSPLGVLVPGAIFTHRLEVHVPDEALALHRPSDIGASGTIASEDLHLTDSDRRALAAVFSPLLRTWPRRGAHPLSYQEAANLLGGAWTGTSVRKHLERVRQRMAESGMFFDGTHAKDDLGQYLIDNGVLTAEDLAVVDPST